MDTAKKLGYKKGDFVLTAMGWGAIIISDAHTATPCCEVWGLEHEMGSVYATDLTRMSFAEFKAVAENYGFDGTAYAGVSKKAIAEAKIAVTR